MSALCTSDASIAVLAASLRGAAPDGALLKYPVLEKLEPETELCRLSADDAADGEAQPISARGEKNAEALSERIALVAGEDGAALPVNCVF